MRPHPFSVSADLSAFAGELVTLSFTAGNFDPLRTSSLFGVDNIGFEAVPGSLTPVPLPASAWLLLAAVLAIGRLKRRVA